MRNIFKSVSKLSISLSIFIILIGIASSVFLHFNMHNKVSNAKSRLGDVAQLNDLNNNIQRDLKTIIHDSQKQVVCIEWEMDGEKVIGSGFLYDNLGDIVTNAHVVDGISEVTVKMADTTVYKGSVIGRGEDIDIALIRVPQLNGKKPIKILKDKKMEIGDEIIALGSPLGLQNTATIGIISGVGRDFNIEKYNYKNMYQISAPISPGNSGGPLLDKKTGSVVGINSAKAGEETIGFTIPINQVISLIESWKSNPIIDKNKDNTQGIDSDKENIEELSQYLIQYFYSSLNSGDYVTAYSLIGSSWQKSMPYEKFRNGFLNTQSVDIDEINCNKKSGDIIGVNIIIEANERVDGGNTIISYYKVTYEMGYENKLLKILKGKAVKIKK